MTSTHLKIIALITMFIDHVGQFIPDTPEWFHWIGRVAAPLFIYTVAIAYQHTKNRKKYITRLYLFSLGMACLNYSINIVFNETQLYITNNFFASLFLIVMILSIFEKRKIKYLFFLLTWQIIATLLSMLFVEILEINLTSSIHASYQFFGSIFGSILFVEGGPLFILLGLLLYLTRKNKGGIVFIYSAFSLFCYMAFMRWGHIPEALYSYILPFGGYQWMMIAALPLMLLYNGKKGAGLKYFFYIFYPSHIVILYVIGVLLQYFQS